MSSAVRRHGPYLTITLLILFLLFTYFFSTPPPVKLVESKLVQWASLVAAFAILVGTIDILKFHLKALLLRAAGQWEYSAVLVAMIAIGLVTGVFGELTGAGVNYPPFAWLYNTFYIPSNAAVYSILVFFIASASYRAFRIRNTQALLLFVVGIIIMLANTGVGYIIWPGFIPIGNWINTNLVAAAFRPILIGAGFGIIMTGLRALLGRELYRKRD